MLDEFLRQTNLPKELRSRVRDYSEFLTRKHKYLSEKVLLDDLSPALRRAVNRHVNRDILDSVPVFKFGSAAFRTTMAQELQPVLGVKVRGGWCSFAPSHDLTAAFRESSLSQRRTL